MDEQRTICITSIVNDMNALLLALKPGAVSHLELCEPHCNEHLLSKLRTNLQAYGLIAEGARSLSLPDLSQISIDQPMARIGHCRAYGIHATASCPNLERSLGKLKEGLEEAHGVKGITHSDEIKVRGQPPPYPDARRIGRPTRQ